MWHENSEHGQIAPAFVALRHLTCGLLDFHESQACVDGAWHPRSHSLAAFVQSRTVDLDGILVKTKRTTSQAPRGRRDEPEVGVPMTRTHPTAPECLLALAACILGACCRPHFFDDLFRTHPSEKGTRL